MSTTVSTIDNIGRLSTKGLLPDSPLISASVTVLALIIVAAALFKALSGFANHVFTDVDIQRVLNNWRKALSAYFQAQPGLALALRLNTHIALVFGWRLYPRHEAGVKSGLNKKMATWRADLHSRVAWSVNAPLNIALGTLQLLTPTALFVSMCFSLAYCLWVFLLLAPKTSLGPAQPLAITVLSILLITLPFAPPRTGDQTNTGMLSNPVAMLLVCWGLPTLLFRKEPSVFALFLVFCANVVLWKVVVPRFVALITQKISDEDAAQLLARKWATVYLLFVNWGLSIFSVEWGVKASIPIPLFTFFSQPLSSTIMVAIIIGTYNIIRCCLTVLRKEQPSEAPSSTLVHATSSLAASFITAIGVVWAVSSVLEFSYSSALIAAISAQWHFSFWVFFLIGLASMVVSIASHFCQTVLNTSFLRIHQKKPKSTLCFAVVLLLVVYEVTLKYQLATSFAELVLRTGRDMPLVFYPFLAAVFVIMSLRLPTQGWRKTIGLWSVVCILFVLMYGVGVSQASDSPITNGAQLLALLVLTYGNALLDLSSVLVTLYLLRQLCVRFRALQPRSRGSGLARRAPASLATHWHVLGYVFWHLLIDLCIALMFAALTWQVIGFVTQKFGAFLTQEQLNAFVSWVGHTSPSLEAILSFLGHSSSTQPIVNTQALVSISSSDKAILIMLGSTLVPSVAYFLFLTGFVLKVLLRFALPQACVQLMLKPKALAALSTVFLMLGLIISVARWAPSS